MWIKLSEIQPAEDYLRRPTVDYFFENPKKVWEVERDIRIGTSPGFPFKYHAIDGNTRLYVLYKLGVGAVSIEPEHIRPDYHLEVFQCGIRTFADLENRIVSEEEYDRINLANLSNI